MEPGDTAGTRSGTGGWRDAVRDWRDNPLYIRLRIARRRGESRTGRLGRYAPLIIALLPAGITVAAGLIGGRIITSTDIAAAVSNAAVAFVITACIIWFAQGFHQFVLDCMLLLNRSQRRQVSVTIDDLSAVSGLGNHDIAVGALAAILPGLWLRIFVTAACAMLIYLAYSTDFLIDIAMARVSNEALLAMAFALPAVCLVTFGGILATIALALYLVSMSENYSFSLASATAVLYSLGALFWLPWSAALAFITMEISRMGLYGPSRVDEIWAISLVLAPLTFVLLVWLALILVRAAPWLRPVYALGSPWLNPVLLLASTVMFLALNTVWLDDESTGVAVMQFLYHFGSFAPLSLTHLPTIALLGLDLDVQGVAMQLALYAFHLGVQLLMIVICARYAVSAIENRRQSPLS